MRSGDPPRYDSCVIMVTKTLSGERTSTEYFTLGNSYAWQGACAHFYAEFCGPFVLEDHDDDEGDDDGA